MDDTSLPSDASSTTSDGSQSSLLDDLNELIAQTQRITLQHEEALVIMNHIKDVVDDTIYVTYRNEQIDLDTVLMELHHQSLQVIHETGNNPFTTLLLDVL